MKLFLASLFPVFFCLFPVDPAAFGSELPKAPMGPAVSGPLPDDPGKFALAIFPRWTGRRLIMDNMIQSLDAELLVRRAAAGLEQQLPASWLQAAITKFTAEAQEAIRGQKIPEFVLKFFLRNGMTVMPRLISSRRCADPDRYQVLLRLYRRTQGATIPTWYQVFVYRHKGRLLLEDIVCINDETSLSQEILIAIGQSKSAALQAEPHGVTGSLFLKTLGSAFGAALLLGLLTYFLLVRGPRDRPGRRTLLLFNWLVVLGPLAAGVVCFLSGYMQYLNGVAAINRMLQRSASLASCVEVEKLLSEGMACERRRDRAGAADRARKALLKTEEALSSSGWPENRKAMVLQVRALLASGDQRRARRMLELVTADMNPPLLLGFLELSTIAERERRWRKASESLRDLITAIGEDSFLLCRQAQYAVQQGDKKGADVLLQRARKAQSFDDPGENGAFDAILVLARSAVRAAQGNAAATVADFRLALASAVGNQAGFYNVGYQIVQMSKSRQFKPVREFASFNGFIKELTVEIKEIARRYQKPAGSGGRSGGGAGSRGVPVPFRPPEDGR
jgi:hypothetical protein